MPLPRPNNHKPSNDKLWLALFFPQLHIDMLNVGEQDHQPLAVVVQEGARRLIMSTNAASRGKGIHPGLALNSAYAIAPELKVIEYDERTQRQHLEQLSLWSLQYSSWVTPRMPDLILIEIGASLSLFNGLDSLLAKLHQDMRSQNLLCQTGIAPNPTAAALFARMGIKERILTTQNLHPALDDIPVAYLPLNAFTQKGLRQSGIKRCKQLFALPATALSRRFGADCTDLIYKLLGKLPDVCPAFTTPETFSHEVDLPLDAPDTDALQFPLNRHLSALGGFLQSVDLGVKKLRLCLNHHKIRATKIDIGFLEATADHKHVFKVACERLNNTVLPAPVCAIGVYTLELAAITRDARDLFQKSQGQPSSVEQLIDSLEARLGTNTAYTLALHDDHRPEKAWCSALLDNNTPPTNWPARPLWLLKEPIAATSSLEIKSSAERIENGWWEDGDVRRDYFIAADLHGTHYWVFQERSTSEALFIHGVFS